MDKLHLKEKAKYEQLHSHMDYSSKSIPWLLDILRAEKLYGKCLELGCGNGQVVHTLQREGIDITGMDITLAGIRYPGGYREATIWDMPWKAKLFDFTFSTDVLEHLPPSKVAQAINEINRITKHKTIHIIATWEDNPYLGHVTHLTVKPISWWAAMFKVCDCKVQLIERTKYGYNTI